MAFKIIEKNGNQYRKHINPDGKCKWIYNEGIKCECKECEKCPNYHPEKHKEMAYLLMQAEFGNDGNEWDGLISKSF